MKAEQKDERLNTKEAAELLGMAEESLRGKRYGKGTKRRPGPPWWDLDGGIVYLRSELEAYMKSRRREPKPAKRAVPPKSPDRVDRPAEARLT